MDHLQFEEQTDCSCRALSYFLSDINHAKDPMMREMILRDLCWRVGDLETLERAIVLAETCHSILPDQLRSAFSKEKLKFSEFSLLRRSKKEHRDIGIVTVIGKELEAVLTSLGRAPDDNPDEHSGEFSYWNADINRQARRPLKVVVTMIGEPRNVPCAIALERLLNDFDLDAVIMIGIAAGPRSKTKLGDVVYADQVHDYEEYRLELVRWFGWPTLLKRKLHRPKYISTRKVVKDALERMSENRFERFFTETLTRIPENKLPTGYKRDTKPEIHDGTIAAGEKLIADGSVEKMLRFDQRIRAVDMEDSGFAQVADFKMLPWCIFRGISDYADPHKEKGWQFVAALAAACAAVSFLKTTWESPIQN